MNDCETENSGSHHCILLFRDLKSCSKNNQKGTEYYNYLFISLEPFLNLKKARAAITIVVPAKRVPCVFSPE